VKNRFRFLYTFAFCGLLFVLKSCIEPFAPPEITQAERYLVVDGFLNTQPGASSQIRLSRTQNVSEKGNPQAVFRAKVTVVGNRGSRFSLVEAENGIYHLAGALYKENEKYQLQIRTVDGKEYQSDFVPVVKTPPIDSLSYKVSDGQGGVQVYVHTQDPQNKTRFYRWSFDETWEYRTSLYSVYELVKKDILRRELDISTCWSNAKASRIVLGSSVKLSKDIIRNQPVTYVGTPTGKLRVKYSILVKQYGLTQEEYEYWTTLSKTTEGTGSLFDPQPSQVTGNIRCTNDPSQLVFGFFSASSQEEKRIFITERLGRNTPCDPTDTLSYQEVLESMDLILDEYYPPNSFTPEYLMGTPECADCRLRGGVAKKPDFWQ
jgi:hypothetical protein